MTTARYGYGGWVRVDDADLPGPLYVRLSEDRGRPFVSELYLDGRGREITEAHVRTLSPGRLAAWLHAGMADRLAQSREHPGPDLSRLASHFSTTWGTRARHWVADSWRAQVKDSGVPQAPMGRDSVDEGAQEPRLEPPAAGISDDFLEQVAAAYSYAVMVGRSPGPYILGRMPGYSIHTVRGWVREARRRGIMPPGKAGRIV